MDLVGIATAALVAGVGVVLAARAAIAARRRSALRRTADELLRSGVRPNEASPLLRWRTEELTSPHTRRSLARALHHMVHELEGRALPGPVPLYRPAARRNLDLLRALELRLLDLDHRVEPHGVVLVDDLLTDGVASPLYGSDHAEELRPALMRCLAALDGKPEPEPQFVLASAHNGRGH